MKFTYIQPSKKTTRLLRKLVKKMRPALKSLADK